MSVTASRLRGGLTAATAALLGLLAPLAAVADEPVRELVVDGRVVYRVADPVSPDGDGAFHEGSVTTAYAEVDDALIDLSAVQAPLVGAEIAPADGLPAGGAVAVTIEAPAGLGDDEAVAAVVEAPGDGDGASGARVVDVAVTDPGPSTSAAPRAGLVSGVHQVVVVPARWSATAAVPTAELQSAAAGTAEYWERQSNGRVDVQASVSAAVTVTRPATCDADAIMRQVLTQTGLTTSATKHVAVWFPEHDGCGWAGLGSITGGSIWLNGASSTYVLAHELGHNLGLGHANTLRCTAPTGARVPLTPDGERCSVTEYGDNTDVMGQGRDLARPGNIASGFAASLGWADIDVVSGPVTAPRAVDLAPLSQPTGLRGIRVDHALGPVFTDFRPAVGADALHEPRWAGVQSRLLITDPVYRYPTSYLLDLQPSLAPFSNPSLPVGGSWEVPGSGVTVTTTSTGTTARVTLGPSAEAAQNERWVTRVYQDLFGRAPDAGGLRAWTTRLQSGMPRATAATSLAASDEHRSRLIAAAYQDYLGRAPDAQGAAHWLQAVRAGSTLPDVEGRILSSSEYYRTSGGTPQAWVTRLYGDVLGRTPSAAEVGVWTGRIAAGMSQPEVARRFLVSTEHVTAVVDGYYVALLGRNVDPGGQRTWVGALQGGTRLETVIGRIIGSAEYLSRV